MRNTLKTFRQLMVNRFFQLKNMMLLQLFAKSLIENPVTSKYFDKKIQAGLPHIDFYYQLPIYFKHRGIDCKALLDFCLVFKTPEGKIFKVVPLDLKTTRFSTLSFPIAMRQRRYDIQAVWYDIAIKEWLKGQDTRRLICRTF